MVGCMLILFYAVGVWQTGMINFGFSCLIEKSSLAALLGRQPKVCLNSFFSINVLLIIVLSVF